MFKDGKKIAMKKKIRYRSPNISFKYTFFFKQKVLNLKRTYLLPSQRKIYQIFQALGQSCHLLAYAQKTPCDQDLRGLYRIEQHIASNSEELHLWAFGSQWGR